MSAKQIKTIILCGGIGYRLKEETEFKPKPMIEIGGMPIIWHIMKIYSHYGFHDFIIALGYKGNLIKDYFLKYHYYGTDFTLDSGIKKTKFYKKNMDKFKITFVDTGSESMTGERVRRIRSYINEDYFMVTYGDGLANININDLFKFHKDKKKLGTVTGVYPQMKYGGLDGRGGLVTNFEKKTKIRQLINGGFMVFKKKVFDYIEKDSMIEDVFDPLISKNELALYEHKGFFHAMDTYADMEDLNKKWRKNPTWKIWS